MLIENKIWFGSAKDFNDPFDCQLKSKTEYDKNDIILLINRLPTNEIEKANLISNIDNFAINEYENLVNNAMKHKANKAGITCFTSREDDLLLWTHYANSHTGICLKFDVLKSLETFALPIIVKYVNKYPEYNYIKDYKDELIDFMFQTKSLDWEYENEYRILKPEIGEYDFNKDALVELIFGVNASNESIERYKDILSSNGYNTKIKYATVSDSEYKIVIKDNK